MSKWPFFLARVVLDVNIAVLLTAATLISSFISPRKNVGGVGGWTRAPQWNNLGCLDELTKNQNRTR